MFYVGWGCLCAANNNKNNNCSRAKNQKRRVAILLNYATTPPLLASLSAPRSLSLSALSTSSLFPLLALPLPEKPELHFNEKVTSGGSVM
jgi:hypothetical protein